MYSFGFCTFVYFKVGKGGVWLKNQFVYLLLTYLSIDLRNEKNKYMEKMQYFYNIIIIAMFFWVDIKLPFWLVDLNNEKKEEEKKH